MPSGVLFPAAFSVSKSLSGMWGKSAADATAKRDKKTGMRKRESVRMVSPFVWLLFGAVGFDPDLHRVSQKFVNGL